MEDQRKTSVEIEMENYLETELRDGDKKADLVRSLLNKDSQIVENSDKYSCDEPNEKDIKDPTVFETQVTNHVTDLNFVTNDNISPESVTEDLINEEMSPDTKPEDLNNEVLSPDTRTEDLSLYTATEVMSQDTRTEEDLSLHTATESLNSPVDETVETLISDELDVNNVKNNNISIDVDDSDHNKVVTNNDNTTTGIINNKNANEQESKNDEISKDSSTMCIESEYKQDNSPVNLVPMLIDCSNEPPLEYKEDNFPKNIDISNSPPPNDERKVNGLKVTIDNNINDIDSPKSSSPSPGPTGPTLSIPKIKLGCSPSRIPSRKNSSTMSTASAVLSKDLHLLETRLERYVSTGSGSSECSETSATSDTSGGAKNVTSRLYNSQTASSRAKTQDKSGGVSPQENKTSTNILKSTLKRMTNFSIGNNGKSKDTKAYGGKALGEKAEVKTQPRNPFLGSKSRVPRSSQSPGPGVGRSKSFKDPPAPVLQHQNSGDLSNGDRNNVYTSSLRRTKMKNQSRQREDGDPEEIKPNGKVTRTGTVGMEKGAMMRSVSASRGARAGGKCQPQESGAKLIRKSRHIQTSLTKDPAIDSPDADKPGQVNFQVWLPELLGEADTNIVETEVTDYSEPVDVRKNRSLNLENMKLTREVERLKAHQTENELLRDELRTSRSRLEDEQKCRMKIQTDLEQYQDRVRVCMESMDSVEQQFESRDLALTQLEGDNQRGGEIIRALQERLGHAEVMIGGQKMELEKSLAAQKTLIQQLQESEAEARELQEFLQAEKGTLSDALKDNEQEIRKLEIELKAREDDIKDLEENSVLLVRRSEQSRQELGSARAELEKVKEKAREMLLAQGAEMSRASVSLSSLVNRLEQLLGGMAISGDDLGDLSDKSEESVSDPAVYIDLIARRSSQFLVTPTESFDKSDLVSEFSKAMMVTSTGSEGLEGKDQTTISSLASAIQDRQDVESSDKKSSLDITVPSLVDQIIMVDSLLAKLMVSKSNGNLSLIESGILKDNISGSGLDLSMRSVEDPGIKRIIEDQAHLVADLRSQLLSKDQTLSDTLDKFSKNKKILTSNWEQAESEVRRLDDIFHDTIDTVVEHLVSEADLLTNHPNLSKLVVQLKQKGGLVRGLIDNGNNDVMSCSLGPNNTNINLSLMSQSVTNSNIKNQGMNKTNLSEPCLTNLSQDKQNLNDNQTR